MRKCCCNCLHCARWRTSKGIECHCDITDRYLGYLEVMDTDITCSRWEKENKWDIEKEHDKQIRNDAIYECINILNDSIPLVDNMDIIFGFKCAIERLEQLKEDGKNVRFKNL